MAVGKSDIAKRGAGALAGVGRIRKCFCARIRRLSFFFSEEMSALYAAAGEGARPTSQHGPHIPTQKEKANLISQTGLY
jgi:hypothetical protein